MSYQILENCVGCTICAKNCPVGAITGEPKQVHIINGKRCVECGVCGKICAKGAVTDSAGIVSVRVSKQDWMKPKINKQLCCACNMCVMQCTFECISIIEPKVRGDIMVYAVLSTPEQCVGCGLCEIICPINAISMHKLEAQKHAQE